jgi:pyridoxal phosphate enzyme (YggS family)
VTEITDHLADILERVARAARQSGRTSDDVTIVAVSKQQPAAAIAAAYDAGIRHFGESYVQEALPKMAALAGLPITWHFVGQLQGNKTRAVAERFDWVHTVDRARIAQRLSDQRPPFAPALNVLIQVNQGDESRKGGVATGEAAALARGLAELPRLRLRGLMTLPPQTADPAQYFAELAALRAELTREGLNLDTLSMGMSADFDAAVAAGASMIRIGTALFGNRSSA